MAEYISFLGCSIFILNVLEGMTVVSRTTKSYRKLLRNLEDVLKDFEKYCGKTRSFIKMNKDN